MHPDLNLSYLPSPKLNICIVPTSSKEIESTFQVDTNDSYILEQQVDITRAKFHSMQFTSLTSIRSSSASVTPLNELPMCNVSTNPSEESRHSRILGHSESHKVQEVVKVLSYQFLTMEYPRGHPQATLTPLLNRPLSAKIIAPDGTINTFSCRHWICYHLVVVFCFLFVFRFYTKLYY